MPQERNLEIVRRGFERFLATGEPAWDTMHEDVEVFDHDIMDAGEKVIVVLRVKATGRGSGVALERQDAIVHAMRDGLVARMDYYNNRKQALEAVGLVE